MKHLNQTTNQTTWFHDAHTRADCLCQAVPAPATLSVPTASTLTVASDTARPSPAGPGEDTMRSQECHGWVCLKPVTRDPSEGWSLLLKVVWHLGGPELFEKPPAYRFGIAITNDYWIKWFIMASHIMS